MLAATPPINPWRIMLPVPGSRYAYAGVIAIMVKDAAKDIVASRKIGSSLSYGCHNYRRRVSSTTPTIR